MQPNFMLLMLKIIRTDNVRFFLKSQLPDAFAVLSHSPETHRESFGKGRIIEGK